MEGDFKRETGNESTDDLKVIKSLDANAVKALHKAGIHRFADLSRYSAEELSNVLRSKAAADYPPAVIRSKNWIKQAKMLVGRSEEAAAEKKLGDKGAENQGRKALQKKWRNHAEFSVFFDSMTNSGDERKWQTRVYHAQTGKEKVFQGYDPSGWTAWMARQADLRVEAEALSPGTERTPSVEVIKSDEIQFRIAAFDISETQRNFKNRLVVSAAFTVRGPKAEDLMEACVPYRLEIELVDLERNTSRILACSRGRLEAEKAEYAQRYELDMPEAGLYQMHCLAVLPPAEMAAYRIIPNIRVVP
jgi:hypothetical protein